MERLLVYVYSPFNILNSAYSRNRLYISCHTIIIMAPWITILNCAPPPFWISEQGGGALWLVLAPWCVAPGGGILPFRVHDFKQGASISIYNQYLSIHLSFYPSIHLFLYSSLLFYSSILLFILTSIHISFYPSI